MNATINTVRSATRPVERAAFIVDIATSRIVGFAGREGSVGDINCRAAIDADRATTECNVVEEV